MFCTLIVICIFLLIYRCILSSFYVLCIVLSICASAWYATLGWAGFRLAKLRISYLTNGRRHDELKLWQNNNMQYLLLWRIHLHSRTFYTQIDIVSSLLHLSTIGAQSVMSQSQFYHRWWCWCFRRCCDAVNWTLLIVVCVRRTDIRWCCCVGFLPCSCGETDRYSLCDCSSASVLHVATPSTKSFSSAVRDCCLLVRHSSFMLPVVVFTYTVPSVRCLRPRRLFWAALYPCTCVGFLCKSSWNTCVGSYA